MRRDCKRCGRVAYTGGGLYCRRCHDERESQSRERQAARDAERERQSRLRKEAEEQERLAARQQAELAARADASRQDHLLAIRRMLLQIATDGVSQPEMAMRKATVVMQGSDFQDNLEVFWSEVARVPVLLDAYFTLLLADLAHEESVETDDGEMFVGLEIPNGPRQCLEEWLSNQPSESVWRSAVLPGWHRYQERVQRELQEQQLLADRRRREREAEAQRAAEAREKEHAQAVEKQERERREREAKDRELAGRLKLGLLAPVFAIVVVASWQDIAEWIRDARSMLAAVFFVITAICMALLYPLMSRFANTKALANGPDALFGAVLATMWIWNLTSEQKWNVRFMATGMVAAVGWIFLFAGATKQVEGEEVVGMNVMRGVLASIGWGYLISCAGVFLSPHVVEWLGVG